LLIWLACLPAGALLPCYTSCAAVDIEEQLYQHAASLGITCITITQVGGQAGGGVCCACLPCSRAWHQIARVPIRCPA
jgi:hypothetical protein